MTSTSTSVASSVADNVLSLASAEALVSFERVRGESTSTQSTDDEATVASHLSDRLLAESRSSLAALVGALSLDPTAEEPSPISDSHKNAKNAYLGSGVLPSSTGSAGSDSSNSSSGKHNKTDRVIRFRPCGSCFAYYNLGQTAVTISQASQAAAAAVAALEGIVVDDSLMADVTEEMLEINAFDLLRSLERQASQLQAEAETIALAQQQAEAEAEEEEDEVDVDPADSPPQAKAVRPTASMSVSVPNLCVSTSESRDETESTEGTTPAAFLESFANVARRRHQAGSASNSGSGAASATSGGSSGQPGSSTNRASAGSNAAGISPSTTGSTGAGPSSTSGGNAINAASVLFPRGPNSVSSLVRLALSSNFPGGLLSTAQSYPSLSNTLSSLSASAQAAGVSSTSPGGGASGLSQALSMSLTSSDSEQVSLEDFLESCRAGTLLAELEDDDELPEPDEDDNEDDDENEDDEDFEEVTEDDGGLAGESRHVTNTKRRSWDDEFVLKRQFSALIPAFDPRPGRTNVNQTTDLEIPPPGASGGSREIAGAEAVVPSASASAIPSTSSSTAEADLVPQPKLHLTIRGPSMPNVSDVEIELSDNDSTVFRSVQKLVQSSALGNRYFLNIDVVSLFTRFRY